MSRSSAGSQALSGKRLHVAIAVWLVLVLAGGLCTWYGWLAPSAGRSPAPKASPTTAAQATTSGASESADEDQEGEEPTAASESVSMSTAEPTATPNTSGSGAASTTVPLEEEGFGYGVAVNGVGGGDPAYWMGQVESLGLGWVKQQLRWAHFEDTPGEMDWSGFDAVVDAANKRGLKVMLSVVDAPEWSRSYTDQNTEGAPPDNLDLVADYVGRLVDRYQGRIHAIEVWNEQNLDREWDTAEGVDAERYVEMLRLAYRAVKSRDPNIMVISGALSPTGVNCNVSWPECQPTGRPIIVDDFVYFEQMIAAGFLNYCDCVGAHHNGINIPPDAQCDGSFEDPSAESRGYWDNPDHSWCFRTTLEGYHERVASAGSDKPLCVTEFGWPSAEGFDGYPPGFEFSLDNTLEEQAKWDVQAFKLMREWGFVRAAFLWNLNYSQLGWGPEDPNAPYGLIDFRGAPRPAFDAVREMEKP